jgi:hypothetical protein
MDRDYELIRRLKKITPLLHNSQIVIRKNEVVYRYRGYFEAKSKDYDTTMKRAVKEYPL